MRSYRPDFGAEPARSFCSRHAFAVGVVGRKLMTGCTTDR
jgi:hypothetical protein